MSKKKKKKIEKIEINDQRNSRVMGRVPSIHFGRKSNNTIYSDIVMNFHVGNVISQELCYAVENHDLY